MDGWMDKKKKIDGMARKKMDGWMDKKNEKNRWMVGWKKNMKKMDGWMD